MQDQDTLAQFYRHEYRKTFKNTDTPKPHHIYRAGLVAAERVAFLKSDVSPGQWLLEPGAGGGELSCLAGKAGLDVTAVDLSTGYLEFARVQYGLTVVTEGYDSDKITGPF